MEKQPTNWQMVFSLSKVNGADNCQDLIEPTGWKWPETTWLKNRLKLIKEQNTKDKL
jgi:hypothetical protein